jgi:hypothetical protein
VHPARKRLRFARCCYGHLAGELGVKLLAALHARAGLVTSQGGFDLTKDGVAWLANMDLQPDGRALELTPVGTQVLVPML